MACSIWNVGDCAPEGADTDLISILMLDGYDGPSSSPYDNVNLNPATGELYPSNPVTGPSTGQASADTTVTVQTTTPALTPVTQDLYTASVKEVFNSGWNTSSRTVDQILNSTYIQAFCKDGIVGAFLGVAPIALDHWKIHLFSHAIIVSLEGVRVMEGGIITQVLRSAKPLATSDIRIYRHADNTVVYVITTGSEVFVYKSLTPLRTGVGVPAYVYGRLYDSGDQITAASFNSGEVGFGEV